ncbi:MAG: putative Ig domain-containing protein [Gammaproteobacteria bacterium]|nr:putative Ig domain-containing protein [Gammaproteobacteria bacterium]
MEPGPNRHWRYVLSLMPHRSAAQTRDKRMDQRKFCFPKGLLHCLLATGVTFLITSCGGDSSGGTSAPLDGGQNQSPQIAGTAPTVVASGQGYSFQPSASDPNGDDLRFSITNQPDWLTFDPSNGRLTGTPTPADVGTYSNITVRVSDGMTSAALAAFSITVTQISTGNATISWLPPTQNTDGTPLTDLAGFRIYYGTSATAMTQSVNITNPGLTSYMIENLGAATWYFTVRAYAADGAESAPSNVASKTVQ